MTRDEVIAEVAAKLPLYRPAAAQEIAGEAYDLIAAQVRGEITAELRSSVLAVKDRLDGLERSGLIRRAEGGKCRFDESSPDAALVPELQALFAKRPFTIMNLILKNPTDKIRTFADAFRLKREKDKE